MPKIPRLIGVNLPHHITQRGNHKHTVFYEEDDYIRYLKLFEHYRKKHNVSVLAYCLMPNHVHFVAIPERKDSFSKAINVSHMRYTQQLNKKRDMSGSLWQGRYYSCILDEPHVYHAIKYVENNPVRAGSVNKPWDWKWSSASAHIGKGKDIIVLSNTNKYMNVVDWKEYLYERQGIYMMTRLRTNTISGKPLCNDSYISELEKILGRQI